MERSDVVEIGRFANAFEAGAAVSALEAAGIEAMVSGDDAAGLRPELWVHGVAVLVRHGDVERAGEVLSAAGEAATNAMARSYPERERSVPTSQGPMAFTLGVATVSLLVLAPLVHWELFSPPRWARDVLSVASATIPIVLFGAAVWRVRKRRRENFAEDRYAETRSEAGERMVPPP